MLLQALLNNLLSVLHGDNCLLLGSSHAKIISLLLLLFKLCSLLPILYMLLLLKEVIEEVKCSLEVVICNRLFFTVLGGSTTRASPVLLILS